MDYIENTDTQSVGKFTKKFITNYIIGAILIGVVVGIISEILSAFLPTQLQSIANFLLTIFGFWKISLSAVETSLKEVNINSDNVNKVLKNIFIFLIVLLVINILFTYISFKFSTRILSSLTNALTINLIINIVATIIQYAIIMLFCKNKLEEIVLGKKINKTLYIVLLVIAVIILCSSMLFKNNSNTNNNSTNTTNNTNSAIENKYPNAKWVEVGCSSSTNVDSNVATVSVNLGHYKEDTVEKYKVVKIICTIYKESTNEVIGTSETYYEDVELEYGYFSFMKTIRVKLSTPFVGNDFSSKIEAYGIPE
ncbi:unknown [Clostridium sp. CAG:356]|nr:unknown [Clostridium sp. CAG:356]